MNIAIALEQIYPDAPPDSWLVRDDSDGNGPYIAEWNYTEPQPTQAEIAAAWALWDAGAADRAWAIVKNQRDQLLRDCDWTQAADAPLSDGQKTEWQVYRQALRDIPQAFASADSVVWPEPPDFN